MFDVDGDGVITTDVNFYISNRLVTKTCYE